MIKLSLIITYVLIFLVCFKIIDPNTTISLKRPSSKICLGWEYLRFWWISFYVMDLWYIKYWQLSWHTAVTWFHMISIKYFSLFKKKGWSIQYPISLKDKSMLIKLHPEDIFLTHRSAIPSIVNTLNKIIIPTDVYDTYVSHYYDDCRVEFLTWNLNNCQTWFLLTGTSYPNHCVDN